MPLTEIAVKEYTALLSQESTNAPTAIILHNTLGNIVWSRDSTGLYIGTLANSFPEEKTFLTLTDNYGDVDNVIMGYIGSVSTVEIVTDTNAGVRTDDIMVNTPIRIQVYNS